MSSDLLYDADADGCSVLLTMRASGFAQLIVMEPDVEGAIASFPLTPDKEGLANADRIVSALKEWSKHIKEVGLVREEEPMRTCSHCGVEYYYDSICGCQR